WHGAPFATTEIVAVSLHDALPIYGIGFGDLWRAGSVLYRLVSGASRAALPFDRRRRCKRDENRRGRDLEQAYDPAVHSPAGDGKDRKSTRLNSSHVKSSYAVFCLK